MCASIQQRVALRQGMDPRLELISDIRDHESHIGLRNKYYNLLAA